MVAVGVGAGDGDDPTLARRCDDRRDMLGDGGPGVDDDDFIPFAGKICLRSGKCIGRRIMRQQPTDAGFDLFQNGIRGVHGSSLPLTPPTRKFCGRSVMSFGCVYLGLGAGDAGLGGGDAALDQRRIDRGNRIASDGIDVD